MSLGDIKCTASRLRVARAPPLARLPTPSFTGLHAGTRAVGSHLQPGPQSPQVVRLQLGTTSFDEGPMAPRRRFLLEPPQPSTLARSYSCPATTTSPIYCSVHAQTPRGALFGHLPARARAPPPPTARPHAPTTFASTYMCSMRAGTGAAAAGSLGEAPPRCRRRRRG